MIFSVSLYFLNPSASRSPFRMRCAIPRIYSPLREVSPQVRKVLSVAADVIGPPRLARDGTVYYSRRVTEADVWMMTLK